MSGGFRGQYLEPPEPDDCSDALAELRFEFESSTVGIALQALREAVDAVADARDRAVALKASRRLYVSPLTVEERAAERLLNLLPDINQFTEKLVADQFDVELEERKRWS